MFTDLISKTYYGNTIGAWALALFTIFASFIVAKLFYAFSSKVIKKLTEKTETKLDDILVDMSEEPVVFVIIVFGVWFSLSTLNLAPKASKLLDNVTQGLIVISCTWFIARLLNQLYKEYLVPFVESTETELDDQLLPILQRGTQLIVWTLGVIIALNNAGYDVGALLAGLGLGGLAFAMAAKDTISNVFGGFTIFTDHPFRTGDRIQIAGFDGHVKEIGLRSTRLETLKGRMVTIPNAKFADAPVENVSKEPTRRIDATLGLTYDTSPEKIEEALHIVETLLLAEAEITDEHVLGFESFGDFSLNLVLVYYVKQVDLADIIKVQTRFNIAVLKSFNKAGIEFAFPTQTLHHIR